MKVLSRDSVTPRRWRPRGLPSLVGTVLFLSAAAVVNAPASSADLAVGDTVYIGEKLGQGLNGTGLFSLYEQLPATGTPDYWAYCIEHAVPAQTDTAGVIGELDSFVGDNLFLTEEIQSKVLWVLAHSYPALSLDAFGDAVGIPGIAAADAIEATQFAIWRYTDLGFDADWPWQTGDSEAAYRSLVAGANASTGLTPEDLVVTAEITAPVAADADSLVGPFVVNTSRPTAAVSVDPALPITDETGTPIDATAVVDGQEIYLDLRGTVTAGSATVTASASGSSSTGKVISVPLETGGTATADSHAQSIILVTPDTTTTDAEASVSWQALAAPAIGTSLVDRSDGDSYLTQVGGTVVDTVTYTDLEPNTLYTVAGELMVQSTGEPTGITGATTFTSSGTGSGAVDVEFAIDDQYAGQALTAFEAVLLDGVEIATHRDIDDVAQTVYVADLGTTLVDKADGDKNVAATGGTVVDTVAYTNLAPDAEYVVSGELYDKLTGEATGITGSATFTASATGSGTVEVEFVISAQWAGSTLVAFELVAQGGVEVAAHQDLDDQAQTVVVETAATTTEPSSEPETTEPTVTEPTATVPSATVPTDSDTSSTNDGSSTVNSTTPGSGPAVSTGGSGGPSGDLAATGAGSQLAITAGAGLLMLLLGAVTTLYSRRGRQAH